MPAGEESAERTSPSVLITCKGACLPTSSSVLASAHLTLEADAELHLLQGVQVKTIVWEVF